MTPETEVIACPACKHLVRVPLDWLGTQVQCPECKAMFRAPFDSFHADHLPPFVDQLLSEESLRKTGYFEVDAVRHWRQACKEMRPGATQRTSIEMGLVGVVSTQLWHHTFIDASLADLPAPARAAQPARLAS